MAEEHSTGEAGWLTFHGRCSSNDSALSHQTHSLKAFRRLLLAFRAAAHMGADEAEGSELSYVVNDAAVFNKLIMTALKYVPVVLQHHIPSKELPNGKFKLPTNNRKFGALQRSVQSFFSSLHRLLKTLPEPRLLYVCVSESSKMVPFVMQNRRMSREYIKVSLVVPLRSRQCR